MTEWLQVGTTTLGDLQPEGPFAAVYLKGKRRLVFIGAQHENRRDHPRFRMIRETYASFKFDTVITEGFPISWGVNPPPIFDYVATSKMSADGFVEGGETVPTLTGTQQQAARLLSDEADDGHIKQPAINNGITEQHLLGFYVLPKLPQSIGERETSDAAKLGVKSLVEAALARQRDRLRLIAEIIRDDAAFLAWYKETNGKPLAASFDRKKVGPLADGYFGTNKIAFSVSKARDRYLHRLRIDRFKAGKARWSCLAAAV